ncbi:MAG: hypothetical protein ACLUFV_05470 [Acutalibacteraceae bacterium]
MVPCWSRARNYDRIRLSNIVASPVLTADGFAVFNSPQKKSCSVV